MRLACIGIGSNAIRLLTAEWSGTALIRDQRERRGTRLFAGLVNGRLTQQSLDASVEAVRELAEIARADGAERIYAFATSAVRDAENGMEFRRRAEEACGAEVEIISGEQEAVLSYIGASEGGSEGVIDIGGGSTEFTIGAGEDVLGAVSLQMGAVRMNAQKPILSLSDYMEARDACMSQIESGAKELLACEKRDQWVGVGGTMTTLGAMQMSIPLFTPEICEGMTMSFEEISGWGERLAAMSMEERRQVEGLMPHRADIIPSGIAILDAAMRVFGMDSLRLSAHGNMDGYLKKKFKNRC